MTDEEQRTAYLDELIGQNKKIRPVVQSGNQMLDILLNGKLSQAISAGVRVDLLRGRLRWEGTLYPAGHARQEQIFQAER